ncbi:hypothetical protein L1049_007935 [Liquidambar formosana]|uniref:Galactinol--sucrose galactosyltransferase 2 n=1 Tax=Liquidambar formosana TaxID=63359 RepID=A0AAP0S281_LIQFO
MDASLSCVTTLMGCIVPSRLPWSEPLMTLTLGTLLPTQSISPPWLTTLFSLENSSNLIGICFIGYNRLWSITVQLVQLVDVQSMSVLRVQLPGRPTLDCLFADPARDGTSLLKIWNVNKCSGVVGVFNCQGAGWCKVMKKTRIHDASPGTLTGPVHATYVDLMAQVAGADWNGETVAYCHKSVQLTKGASLPITLKVLEYELFHICPLKEIANSISFAPIGLLDMFNSSGAVEQFEVHLATDKKPELFDGEVSSELTSSLSENRSPTATIALKGRGCGRFGAYSSQRPLKVKVGNAETDFNYDAATGLLTLTLTIPVPEEEMYRWPIEIQV